MLYMAKTRSLKWSPPNSNAQFNMLVQRGAVISIHLGLSHRNGFIPWYVKTQTSISAITSERLRTLSFVITQYATTETVTYSTRPSREYTGWNGMGCHSPVMFSFKATYYTRLQTDHAGIQCDLTEFRAFIKNRLSKDILSPVHSLPVSEYSVQVLRYKMIPAFIILQHPCSMTRVHMQVYPSISRYALQ